MKHLDATLDGDKFEIPLGRVQIIIERCKGCGYCIKYCPQKVLEYSGEPNSKGYFYPVVNKEEACRNCCLCDIICPEFAIWSTFDRQIKAKFPGGMIDESA